MDCNPCCLHKDQGGHPCQKLCSRGGGLMTTYMCDALFEFKQHRCSHIKQAIILCYSDICHEEKPDSAPETLVY